LIAIDRKTFPFVGSAAAPPQAVSLKLRVRVNPQTKTPPRLLRGGVFATTWLPLAKRLSISSRFSQSVTWCGLLATVSGQRRPDVSAKPLGSKYSTFKWALTVYV